MTAPRASRILPLRSLALVALLAGCEILQPAALAPQPQAIAAPPPPPAVPPSEESRAIGQHFARVEQSLKMQGLLRADGGGRDTPFNARQLADNFVRIALFDEYVASGGALVARETASRLRRWEEPVRFQVEFGPSIPLAQRQKDAAAVAGYAARLSALTGVPMKSGNAPGNFHVLVLNEDERRNYGPRLQQLVPGIDATAIRNITNMPLSTFCVVYAFAAGSGAGYSKAVAVIRGEHPDALRLSCIHEELAQGMGLANDSPQARPSIFNDDEEFGLLTVQDELLLRILYDRRLKLGMTEPEARPIAEAIAAEMMGDEI